MSAPKWWFWVTLKVISRNIALNAHVKLLSADLRSKSKEVEAWKEKVDILQSSPLLDLHPWGESGGKTWQQRAEEAEAELAKLKGR